MKIVDVVRFNDEIKLLTIRLNEIYELVDYIVLIESNPSPTVSVYNDNIEQFAKYSSKIVCLPESQINQYLATLKLTTSDLIMLSNVGDIPFYITIYLISHGMLDIDDTNIYSFEMQTYYNDHTIQSDSNSSNSKILHYHLYSSINSIDLIMRNLIKVPSQTLINSGSSFISYDKSIYYYPNTLSSIIMNPSDTTAMETNNINDISTTSSPSSSPSSSHLSSITNIPHLLYQHPIPKIAFTFWEGTQLTYLQYLTIYTFHKFNPSYDIIIYHSTANEQFDHFNNNNAQMSQIHPSGYNVNTAKCLTVAMFNQIPNVKIININVCEEYNIKFNASTIYKADVVRNMKLYEHGGIWIDMDILFLKPISILIHRKSSPIQYFVYDSTIPTGLLLSSPKNKCIEFIAECCKAKIANHHLNNDCQQFGPTLWRNCVFNNQSIFTECEILPNNVVYPYMWNEVNLIFKSLVDRIHPNTVGIHWFNGATDARIYEDQFDINKIDPKLNIFEKCLSEILTKHDIEFLGSLLTKS